MTVLRTRSTRPNWRTTRKSSLVAPSRPSTTPVSPASAPTASTTAGAIRASPATGTPTTASARQMSGPTGTGTTSVATGTLEQSATSARSTRTSSATMKIFRHGGRSDYSTRHGRRVSSRSTAPRRPRTCGPGASERPGSPSSDACSPC